MGKKFDRTVFRLTAIVLCATVFAASAMVVWLGDDVDYGFFIRQSIWDSNGSLDSVKTFMFSQCNHYAYVNGRFVAHTLVQLFCGVLGQWAFAICNGLVYIAFLCLLLRISRGRNYTKSPAATVFAALSVLLVFVTKMVPTTQIGFVWMFTLNLLWLRLFANYGKRPSMLCAILLFLLGFLAGNGQEALTLPMSGALALWAVHRRFRLGFRWLPLTGYWLGALAICLSPGTLGRGAALQVPFTDTLLYMALSLRAVWVLLVAVLVLWLAGKTDPGRIYRANRLWANCLLLAIAFNLGIGVYCNRQLFGAELCALVILLRMIPRRPGRWLASADAILAALTIWMAWCQFAGINDIRRQYADIVELARHTTGRSVIMDRHQASLNPMMREFRWYEEIIGFMGNDTHHSLQKNLRARFPKRNPVTLWPSAKERMRSIDDTVISNIPGQFYVVLRDSSDKAAVAHIHSWITGRESTDTVHIGRASVVGTGWKGAIIISPRPFAVLDTVTLEVKAQ